MTEYTQDISGASMQMLKHYHQSNDITMTARGWEVAVGFNTPPDCVAVRVRETTNGGEVTYLTEKDVVTLGGRNIIVDGAESHRNHDKRFWDRLATPQMRQWVESEWEEKRQEP